jgi:hypothetical protein
MYDVIDFDEHFNHIGHTHVHMEIYVLTWTM